MTGTPRIGLALSGGGDSTALLLALREAAPALGLNAYIVDHALRPESAAQARAAADTAERAGARARVLTWAAPRPGQNQARRARHRLLADACRADGVSIVCLAHTLDDRIETLRMRAARPGPDTRLAGPGVIDPSPVWPQGRGLMLARPFLSLTRTTLRRYLALRGAGWIEDPSNADLTFERVRLRAAPLGEAAARRLIARSDAARAALDAERRQAARLIEAGAVLEPWGGVRLDAEAFAGCGAARAFETLVLAVSGGEIPPAPGLVHAGVQALRAGRAWTGAGALLTADGVLGRDPGAARRKTGPRAPVVHLQAGESGVFDARFDVTGPVQAAMRGRRDAKTGALAQIPAPLRDTLPVNARTGAALAGPGAQDPVKARWFGAERIASRLMAQNAPAWFDGVCAKARACAALAKPQPRSNMGS